MKSLTSAVRCLQNDQTVVVTLTRSQVVSVLEEFGISPSRALGQNFVADPNTVRKIAHLAHIETDSNVVEIGAGLGCLTLALAESGANVTAIELDKYVMPVLLRNTAEHNNISIIEGNAMEIDWSTLLQGKQDVALVANLPYNIATPLIADLLDKVPQIKSMLVMVQREVALRFAAQPRTKEYGAVSVKVAYWAKARVVGTVSRNVFVPKPNVDSALVEIVRRENPAVDVDPEVLFPLVRAGFAQRRKMLRSALGQLVDESAFEQSGIAPTARAESLTIEEWGALAKATQRPAPQGPDK